MKKDVITVPKNKCPSSLLDELEKHIHDSWIFLHENVYNYLIKSENVTHSTSDCTNANQSTLISLKETPEYPKKIAFCEVPPPIGKVFVVPLM